MKYIGLGWFGHICRMLRYAIVNQAFMQHVNRQRDRGRQLKSWMDQVRYWALDRPPPRALPTSRTMRGYNLPYDGGQLPVRWGVQPPVRWGGTTSRTMGGTTSRTMWGIQPPGGQSIRHIRLSPTLKSRVFVSLFYRHTKVNNNDVWTEADGRNKLPVSAAGVRGRRLGTR